MGDFELRVRNSPSQSGQAQSSAMFVKKEASQDQLTGACNGRRWVYLGHKNTQNNGPNPSKRDQQAPILHALGVQVAVLRYPLVPFSTLWRTGGLCGTETLRYPTPRASMKSLCFMDPGLKALRQTSSIWEFPKISVPNTDPNKVGILFSRQPQKGPPNWKKPVSGCWDRPEDFCTFSQLI